MPLTIICAKYLFWLVKRPSIYSTLMLKEAARRRIKNSREDSLSLGSFWRLIFLISREEECLFVVFWVLSIFFSNDLPFKTTVLMAYSFLFSSRSASCLTISTIRALSPCKIRSFILVSNTIRKSSNESLNYHRVYHIKFQLVSLTFLFVSLRTLSRLEEGFWPLLSIILLTISAIL